VLLSPSSITTASESFLNIGKLLRSLHMWCDTPESMTHSGAAAAVAAVGTQAISQKGSQSPVVARAGVAVAFFTFRQTIIRL